MDELLKCKDVFEFISFLPNVLDRPVVKNSSVSGRIEVFSNDVFIVAYYDGSEIVHIRKEVVAAA